MDEIHRAIHEALLDAGPKQVAHKMGTSHTSLLNRANPNDDTHRLNVEQFLQILLHTGDMRPLHALAEVFGFELVAKEKAKAQGLATALIHMNKEVADVTKVVAEALEDGRVSQTEAAMIKREIGHVRESLDVLEESVKAA
ncbi:hypothetical protein D3C78_1072440 [compost metagenome]